MTYAVFPMNSSEVGWFKPPVTTVNVPFALTSTSAPVSGSAGAAGRPPTGKIPCEARRGYGRGQIPHSEKRRA